MNQGTYPLAASMVNQINRLDQISNNLANLNTNGFKQEDTTETTFNYYLQRAIRDDITPTKVNIVTNNIPKIDSKFIIGKAGPVDTTGNELDFTLSQADMFFKVQNRNGDIVYTRDGAFDNLDGFLVDSSGNAVLSADNEPIEVNENFRFQIGIEQIPYTNLDKIGNNFFKIKDENQRSIVDANSGVLIQGAIEKSNVNSVSQMVALIDAHRRFDQSQRAVKGIDQLNAALIEKIGNNTN